MTSVRNTIGKIVFNELELPGITTSTLSQGIQTLVAGHSGNVDMKHTSTETVAPVITFASNDVKTILDTVPLDGVQITVASTLEAHLREMPHGGTRSAGATHTILTINEGLLVLDSITAQHLGGFATVNCRAIAVFDGTNAPVVPSTGASATTTALAGTWVLGPTKLSSGTFEGVQSFNLDFGLNVEVGGGAGNVYPDHASVLSRAPSLSFTTKDVSAITANHLAGVQDATVVQYLTHIVEGGGRVADATITHISLTMQGQVAFESAGGPHGSTSDFTVRVTPNWDGTNAIVVVDTTAAIT